MRPEAERAAPVLVLGLGNLLLGDDALGLHLLEGLRARYEADPRLELLDGGTRGLALLPALEGRRALLILDAVALGAPPGSLHVIADAGQAPPRAQAGSPGGAHQTSAGDLLLAARLVGDCPERVVVVGLEPELLRTRIALSPAVAAALPTALAAAQSALRELLMPLELPCTS